MDHGALCFRFSFPMASFFFLLFFSILACREYLWRGPDGIIDMIKVPITRFSEDNLLVFAKSESFHLLSSPVVPIILNKCTGGARVVEKWLLRC